MSKPKPIPKLTQKEVQKFWKHVIKKSANECWMWTGAQRGRADQLYGSLWIQGKPRFAHRIAWMLVNGDIPKDLIIMHSCDNRLCCNPSHLFIGTDLDNCMDMLRKGRRKAARGDRNGARLHPEAIQRGEKHHSAKLSENDVHEIRRLYSATSFTQRALARKFNISQHNVMMIVTRKLWKHI